MSDVSYFNKIKKEDFLNLIEESSLDIDHEDAYTQSIEHINAYNNKDVIDNNVKQLETKWYASLSDAPDYSVYNDPYYICDVWACWKLYSRVSVNVLNSPKSMNGISVVEHIGDVSTVVDIGCGFGYTTALLKEIFNDANVIGTNLEDTWQYNAATKLGKEANFSVVSDINKIKDVDVIFASEYFEHIYEPIAHLEDIINNCNPRFIITANGFNGTAIGHFDEYLVGGNMYPAKRTSRMFNDFLRNNGYKKLTTKIWNSRPAVWERISDNIDMSGMYNE